MSSHQEFRFEEDDSQLLSPRSVNQDKIRTIELDCAKTPITQGAYLIKFLQIIILWGSTIGLFFLNPIIATVFLAIAVFVTIRTSLAEPVDRSSRFEYNQEGWTLRPWKGSPMSAVWENTKGFEIQQKNQDYGLLTLEDMDGKKIKVHIDFPHKSSNVQDFLNVIESHVPESRYRRYIFKRNVNSTIYALMMSVLVLHVIVREILRLFKPGDKISPILYISGYVLISIYFIFLAMQFRTAKNVTNEPVIANVSSSANSYFYHETMYTVAIFIILYLFGRLTMIGFINILGLILMSLLIPLTVYTIRKLRKYPFHRYVWSAYVTEGTLVLKHGNVTIREFISDLDISPGPRLSESDMIAVQGKVADVVLCNKTDTDHTLTELIEGIKAGKTYPPKMSALHPGFNIKYNDADEDSDRAT